VSDRQQRRVRERIPLRIGSHLTTLRTRARSFLIESEPTL
jgi:hypothetical protein